MTKSPPPSGVDAGRQYRERTYRRALTAQDLTAFRVIVKETDLWVSAQARLEAVTRELVLRSRGYIEAYIRQHPGFGRTLAPWHEPGPAPGIVCDMAAAGRRAGVGPMAAVAGAVAEHVGRGLLAHSGQVVVENGGDVFLAVRRPVTLGIFAGQSPLSLRVGIALPAGQGPMAVCTSSGSVGHSLSLGRADAVCVVSDACALADAAATAVANRVRSPSDIRPAIDFGKSISGVKGLVIILGDKIGVWGSVQLVPLSGKKG